MIIVETLPKQPSQSHKSLKYSYTAATCHDDLLTLTLVCLHSNINCLTQLQYYSTAAVYVGWRCISSAQLFPSLVPRPSHVFQHAREKSGRSGRFGDVMMTYLPPFLPWVVNARRMHTRVIVVCLCVCVCVCMCVCMCMFPVCQLRWTFLQQVEYGNQYFSEGFKDL